MLAKPRKTKFKNIDAREFINRGRLHVLCFLMSSLSVEIFDDGRPRWEGDLSKGGLTYDNGSGDIFSLLWEEGQILAAVSDHESPRSNANGDWEKNSKGLLPDEDHSYFFENIPEDKILKLAQAFENMSSFRGDFNITALLWSEKGEIYSPEPHKPALENGLWMFENYLDPLKEALGDPTEKGVHVTKDFYFSELVGDIVTPLQQNSWMVKYGLSTEQLELAYELAEKFSGQVKGEIWHSITPIELTIEQWKKFKVIDGQITDFVTGKPKKARKENFPKIKEELLKIGVKVS